MNINKRLRQTTNYPFETEGKGDDGYKIYDIDEVEFDHYHLQLLTQNGEPAAVEQHNVLSCSQLVRYGFEAETE